MVAFTQHFKVKCNFGTYFFVQCWWPRKSVLQGSSALSEFRTSLSKVLIHWHCVKVKQCYHFERNELPVFYKISDVISAKHSKSQDSRGHLHIFLLFLKSTFLDDIFKVKYLHTSHVFVSIEKCVWPFCTQNMNENTVFIHSGLKMEK